MSVKSSGSAGEPLPSTGDIIRLGVLKKMKTARKKFFVLRAETPDSLARLEYYDSEKKFRSGMPPKRCIPLKTCFDINKRQDTKHKHVIALYTKDDCFCIVLDGEDDLKSWLKDLLTLQHGEEMPEGEMPKPKFEYVWQVQLCERGLGAGRTGHYRLCLTEKTVTLVKIDEPMPIVIELSLASVRSCGNLKNFFFLEVGRSSNLGAGEFWFEADDTNIASNIQTTVSHRFKLIREQAKLANSTNQTNEMQPKSRVRSSSATESSKSNSKKYNSLTAKASILPQGNSQSNTNESNLTPAVTSATTSTTTGAGTGWTGSASHQRTQSLPLATPCTIAPLTDNTITMTTTITTHPAHSMAVSKRHGQAKCSFRDRCDSMPSRPRTSSEGNHVVSGIWGKPYLVPHRSHLRDASHSPPTGSPISPPSDSTGSSYSLPDEHDGPPAEIEHQRLYSTLTPDEVIAEEECPESPRATTHNYVPMNFQNASNENYADMSPHYTGQNFPSNSASMSSVTSGTPSTDLRFIDYPLDKVFSYVSADDDESRPCRAYSVGSKPPETVMQLASTPENSRVRAFSVGSKSKKHFNRVLPPHHPHPSVKSSSAPILSNSRVASSHSSINNPMDDLMEMDFSSTATTRSRTSTNASGSSDARSVCNNRNSISNGNRFLSFLDNLGGSSKTPEGYVEMKPGERTTSDTEGYPYVDMSQGQKSSAYMDMSGNAGGSHTAYMDMSGGSAAAAANYMDMSGSSPVRNSPRPTMTLSDFARQFGRVISHDNQKNHDYVDMNQRRRANSNSSTRTATSPGYQWNSDYSSDYLDMSGRSNKKNDRNSISSHMSSSPHFESISPKYAEYSPLGMSVRIPEVTTNETTEGYVEMTPGDFASLNNTHQRQSSLDSTDDHGDYLNMSGVNKKLSKKERSQPISIQTSSNNQTAKNSSPISISSLLGRRPSPTSTLPKMHLPLSSYSTSSPYSSLPRQKSRKNSGSKDSSSVSSSVTTTPSSSSTMFPLSLNSPSSPASKTGIPMTVKVPASILNVPYKSGKKHNEGNRRNEDDYAMMDFETTSKSSNKNDDMSPYVNYCPGPAAITTPVTLISKRDDGDYAVMKPGTFTTKSTTLPRTKASGSGLASPLATHLSNVGLNEKQTMCFRPIREKDERMQSPKPADQVPDKLARDNKTLETASMDIEEEAPYDTLRSSSSGLVSPAAKISRPNSSNSDKIKISTSRPASTSGTEKTSRPGSVCSEGLLSRLGSNSSVYSSSSSTSTVVGVSRPESTDSDQQLQQHMINLHYASLDLSSVESDEGKSPRTLKNASSEVNLSQGESTFVYADIDFIKSEDLKKANATANNSIPSISSNATVKN